MEVKRRGIPNVIREYRLRALAREAVAWRDLLIAGDEHNADFAAWLLRSKDHLRVWLELTEFDQDLAKFVSSPKGRLVLREASARPRRISALERCAEPLRSIFGGGRVPPLLATLGLVGILAWPAWTFVHSRWPSTTGESSTRIGEHRELTLKDGTVVYLNTSSSVRWSLTPTERVVTLIAGELLVKVHADPRPFGVYHDSMLIRDVGTSYSVRARAPETDVTVFDGEVVLTTALPAARRVVLRRGQAASIPSAEGGEIRVRNLDPAVLDRRRSWTYGRLQFQNETLGSIVAEFNRYNIRQLRLENPCLLDMRASGSFAPTDIDSFAESLPILRIIDFRKRGRGTDELLIDGECP